VPITLHTLPLPRSLATCHLHSFPTRRSSDLAEKVPVYINPEPYEAEAMKAHSGQPLFRVIQLNNVVSLIPVGRMVYVPWQIADRSEEHMSELQSRENLVCRLLLEKKKKKKSQ